MRRFIVLILLGLPKTNPFIKIQSMHQKSMRL